MKVMSVLLLCLVDRIMAVDDDDTGDYKVDHSGDYIPDDSGKYIPDDEGKYIPDFSGLYHDDGTGRYSGDKSGAYSTGNLFKQRRFFNTLPLDTGFQLGNLVGDGSNHERIKHKAKALAQSPKRVTQFRPPASDRAQNYPNTRYADDRKYNIIRQSANVESDGYSWEYETENGITATESGKLANKGSEAEAMRAQGFFQYTGPDNVLYQVTYTADENGFVPVGNHLPTSPPIPEAILQSLDTLRAAGKLQ